MKFYKNLGIQLVTLSIILMVIGSINIFAVTYSTTQKLSVEFINQISFYFLGIILITVIGYININIIARKSFIFVILIIQITLLILVLIFGSKVGLAQRWIDIGIFSIQPAEFLKLTIIIFVASTTYSTQENITENKSNKKKFWIYLKSNTYKLSILIACIASILLVFFQRSLGNTLIITFIFISTFLYSYPKKNLLFGYLLVILVGVFIGFLSINSNNYISNFSNIFSTILIVVGIIFLIYLTKKIFNTKIFFSIILIIISTPTIKLLDFGYNNVLLEYQRKRIDSFLNPDLDYFDSNWHRNQSLNAFGSGRLFGNGFMNGNVTFKGLLPYAHTDFAFASIGEQFGFIGASIVTFIYFFMFYIIIKVLVNLNNKFFKTICFGIFTFLLLNFFQHVGMNIGILPITGMTLPLISYGGSSVISVCISIGIIYSIIKNFLEEKEENVKDVSKLFIN